MDTHKCSNGDSWENRIMFKTIKEGVRAPGVAWIIVGALLMAAALQHWL